MTTAVSAWGGSVVRTARRMWMSVWPTPVRTGPPARTMLIPTLAPAHWDSQADTARPMITTVQLLLV